MRRRLRKKRHLGEFQEFMVEVTIQLRPGTEFESFLDDWIENAVEANELQFGGGGKDLTCCGVLQVGDRDVADGHVRRISEWLAAHRGVATYEIGEPVDACYLKAE